MVGRDFSDSLCFAVFSIQLRSVWQGSCSFGRRRCADSEEDLEEMWRSRDGRIHCRRGA